MTSFELIIRRLKSAVKSILFPTLAPFAAFCGLAILLLAALSFWVDSEARRDEARRVDTLIVLGSQVWPGEQPSPSLRERTKRAIELYEQGYAPFMILSGGLGQYPPAEAEMMRRMAVAAGISDSTLMLDDTSHSTEENLAHAKQIMDAHGWRSALIVSDPFHLLRAKAMARDLGIEAYGSPASSSPTYTVFHFRVWYTVREAVALIWYTASRTLGEPVWLYQALKRLGV